jgi:AraC-like DNA-binding protein
MFFVYFCTEFTIHFQKTNNMGSKMSKGDNGQASVDYAQEIKQLKEQNAALCQEVEMLKDEIIRLVSRNLDMAEQLEESSELRRRVEVAREIFRVNYERQRNADLLDDGQLMALLELRIESERSYFQPDFDAAALAEKMGVSRERLNQLFRKQTIYRTPEAYIDNLRLFACMRMLREHPEYNIAVIAEEAGFANVRTMQRRFQDVLGMSPVEYRLMTTRDL